jgi:hypothetical protein
MTNQAPAEITIHLSEGLRRFMAANAGTSVVMEQHGKEYRSSGTDGDRLILRRLEPNPNRVTAKITIGR